MFCKIDGKYKRAQGPAQTHLTYIQRAKGAISALSPPKKKKCTCKINYQFCLFEPLDLADVAHRLPQSQAYTTALRVCILVMEKKKHSDCHFNCHQKQTEALSAFSLHLLPCIHQTCHAL